MVMRAASPSPFPLLLVTSCFSLIPEHIKGFERQEVAALAASGAADQLLSRMRMRRFYSVTWTHREGSIGPPDPRLRSSPWQRQTSGSRFHFLSQFFLQL